jgi:hypothetical protein
MAVDKLHHETVDLQCYLCASVETPEKSTPLPSTVDTVTPCAPATQATDAPQIAAPTLTHHMLRACEVPTADRRRIVLRVFTSRSTCAAPACNSNSPTGHPHCAVVMLSAVTGSIRLNASPMHPRECTRIGPLKIINGKNM